MEKCGRPSTMAYPTAPLGSPSTKSAGFLIRAVRWRSIELAAMAPNEAQEPPTRRLRCRVNALPVDFPKFARGPVARHGFSPQAVIRNHRKTYCSSSNRHPGHDRYTEVAVGRLHRHSGDASRPDEGRDVGTDHDPGYERLHR